MSSGQGVLWWVLAKDFPRIKLAQKTRDMIDEKKNLPQRSNRSQQLRSLSYLQVRLSDEPLCPINLPPTANSLYDDITWFSSPAPP